MIKDIFDIKNIDDLPEDVLEEIGLSVSFTSKLVTLFKLANRPLTINELTVGFYRKFNEIKTKRQITLKLHNLSTGSNKIIAKCLGKKWKLIEG